MIIELHIVVYYCCSLINNDFILLQMKEKLMIKNLKVKMIAAVVILDHLKDFQYEVVWEKLPTT